MHYIEQVFPAYAGVNLREGSRLRVTASIPRVCGGEPQTAHAVNPASRYSPRMRG